MKVHHIGYLVNNMEEAIKKFLLLGFSLDRKPLYDLNRNVDICFMKMEEIMIEIIFPHNDCKSLKRLSKKIGNAPYHLCYECSSFDREIDELLSNPGCTLVVPPQSATAINGRRVAFLLDNNIGLFELLEA